MPFIGITSTVCFIWLQFSWLLLLREMKNDPCALITMPTTADISWYKDAIQSRYPELRNVFGTVEGLK